MSKERDILKSLLLKEELDVLDNLKQKLLSEEQFTREVSKVLAVAIKRAQKEDKEFERALSKPIKEGVKRAFSDSKQSIVDSMLPIMGQLIRKTVTNSIKQFVSDINRTLELRFSIKSIRWRWQAKKAGISFAEMIFQKTISYKVKELFVINRENGLLVQHVGANDLLIDNNAISAMLTAIQDFIGDSLHSNDTGLMSAEIDNNLILISTGPKAYLATVVLGAATERLKQKSQELIENIHSDFSELLMQESKYQNDTEFEDYLRTHLITKNISDKQKKINWFPWVVGLVLLFSWLFYWVYQRNQDYKHVVELSHEIPGFYLQSVSRKGSGFEIKGLLDPMADLSILENENINITSKPFVSLDKQIIQKRLNRVLTDYPEIVTTLNKNTLTIRGTISNKDKVKLIHRLERVIGITHINVQLDKTKKQEIEFYLQKYKNLQLKSTYKPKVNTIYLSGKTSFEGHQLFKSEFSTKFPDIIITNKGLNIVDSTKNLTQQINSSKINISESMQTLDKSKLSELIKSLHSLVKRNSKIRLLIIGESDCYGTASDEYSQQRASLVKQIFINQGIHDSLIKTTIKPCNNYTNEADQQLKRVSFKVDI